MMQLFFFEDVNYKNFHPLTLTRPVDDLRIGILTISEKWQYALNASSVNRILRPELRGIFENVRVETDNSCLWINSRYLPNENLSHKITGLSEGQCLKHENTIIAAKVDEKSSIQWLNNGAADFNTLFVLETDDVPSITHLWDLFLMNGREIESDLRLIAPPNNAGGQISGHAVLENRNDIYIQDGAIIEAGCLLNAEDGPIFIGKNAQVMAGSLIRGPVAICQGATVNMGAKIYGKTTIGPVCKVGGEINNSIFHSYSNKGHEGFMGNSLIGQWCNFGADTNTSNLKNNYSTIRITNWDDQKEIETGQQFLGTVMGDHSKTAINTQLNTGTVCGVSCNIFSSDFPPKFIPSFSWVGSNVIQTYQLDKALETMKAMMARRDVEMTEEYKQLMKHIFDEK
jgi:UDP-N-acetylglucosamine diphosphorylase/glucosamine-1-phosphate N-acetyltransferase